MRISTDSLSEYLDPAVRTLRGAESGVGREQARITRLGQSDVHRIPATNECIRLRSPSRSQGVHAVVWAQLTSWLAPRVPTHARAAPQRCSPGERRRANLNAPPVWRGGTRA